MKHLMGNWTMSAFAHVRLSKCQLFSMMSACLAFGNCSWFGQPPFSDQPSNKPGGWNLEVERECVVCKTAY